MYENWLLRLNRRIVKETYTFKTSRDSEVLLKSQPWVVEAARISTIVDVERGCCVAQCTLSIRSSLKNNAERDTMSALSELYFERKRFYNADFDYVRNGARWTPDESVWVSGRTVSIVGGIPIGNIINMEAMLVYNINSEEDVLNDPTKDVENVYDLIDYARVGQPSELTEDEVECFFNRLRNAERVPVFDRLNKNRPSLIDMLFEACRHANSLISKLRSRPELINTDDLHFLSLKSDNRVNQLEARIHDASTGATLIVYSSYPVIDMSSTEELSKYLFIGATVCIPQDKFTVVNLLRERIIELYDLQFAVLREGGIIPIDKTSDELLFYAIKEPPDWELLIDRAVEQSGANTSYYDLVHMLHDIDVSIITQFLNYN